MKKILLFLVIISAFHAHAQITGYYDWEWKPCDVSLARFFSIVKKTDSGWIRNDYFIATKKLQMTGLYKDEETKTQNGWFSYFYSNGNLSSMGGYINGKKEGLWISYHFNGMISDSSVYHNGAVTGTRMGWHSNGFISDSAEYSNDGKAVYVSWFDNGSVSSAGRLVGKLKDGPWQFFHNNGRLAAMEKYRVGDLLSRIYYDENGIQLTDTTSKDKDAVFAVNEAKWRTFLKNNLEFPHDVNLVNTDRITIVLSVTISEEGNVEDVYIETPFDPLFDNEALRVMKKSPKWIPAIDHNRRIKTYIRQPISFFQE